MRSYWTVTVLSFAFSPTALFSQQWALETDIGLASHYEWRGLQLDPGLNVQQAVYGSVAWRDLMLTAGIWSLTDLSSEGSVGLPERWGFRDEPMDRGLFRWRPRPAGSGANRILLPKSGPWDRPQERRHLGDVRRCKRRHPWGLR